MASDTPFFLGPQRVDPHLADKIWKKSVEKEDLFASGEGRAARAQHVNPITWEVQGASRAATGSTSGGVPGGADVLLLGTPRSLPGGGRGQRSGRPASQSLSAAGSLVSAARSQTSSCLSRELRAERGQREAAEAEASALRKQLSDRTAKPKAGRPTPF